MASRSNSLWYTQSRQLKPGCLATAKIVGVASSAAPAAVTLPYGGARELFGCNAEPPHDTSPTRRSQTANFAPRSVNCNCLHQKVTGLWLAAPAMAHGLSMLSRLAAPSGWLTDCSTATPAPLHVAHYAQI